MSDVPPPPITPPPGYIPYGVPGGRPQSHKKAITSMILGIVGLFCIPLVLSVLALVLGIQARAEIDRSGGAYGNRGMATAGIVLGIIGAVFGGIFVVSLVSK
jgi:multisubunit Na+/H+ antiporter MnhB subunit